MTAAENDGTPLITRDPGTGLMQSLVTLADRLNARQDSPHHIPRGRRDARISISKAPCKEDRAQNMVVCRRDVRTPVGKAQSKPRPSSHDHRCTWLDNRAGSIDFCRSGDRRALS